MSGSRLLWVDVGMAVAAGLFIALVLFAFDSTLFVPLALAYAIGLVVWAYVAEAAAVRAEAALQTPARSKTELIPH